MSAEVGNRMVMLDGAGRPRAVLATIELTLRRFDEVDAAFFDEGEEVPSPAGNSDVGVGGITLAAEEERDLRRLGPA